MTSPTDRIARVRSLLAALNDHDVAGGMVHLSANVTWSRGDGSLTVNAGPPAVGRDAITASAQGFMTAFPDMKVLLDDLLVHGDRAVSAPDRNRRQ